MEPIRLLHIGVGARARPILGVVSLDNSVYARIKASPLLRRLAPLLLSDARRRRRLDRVPEDVVIHDIRKPLPFASHSIAAVYHSHVLEHLDRDVAERFVREVARVLVPGGVHRVAVPDLERKCRAYLQHLTDSLGDARRAAAHEPYIASIIEQSVRRESAALGARRGWRRGLEAWWLGDARARGETHQWMYDRVSLGHLLNRTGHAPAGVRRHGDSDIAGWAEAGFEFDVNGNPYRPASLIMEARTRVD